MDYWGGDTVFVRDDRRTVVVRGRARGTATCVGDAGQPCLGAACYYGPNGFSRPTFHTSNYASTPYAFTTTAYGYCTFQWVSGSGSGSAFPDRTGTYPSGRGCPGGFTGAYQWDY